MLKGSSGLGCPSLHCLQGCRDRHFFTFPFSTSSLRPDATREQLGKGKGPWSPASWSRLPGWFSPAGGTSFLAWGWGSAQILQGGAARAGGQAAGECRPPAVGREPHGRRPPCCRPGRHKHSLVQVARACPLTCCCSSLQHPS